MRNRRSLALLSFVVVLAVLAATGASHTTSGDGTGGRADRLADPPDHLIVVIEENHSLEQIIGSPAAPFLSRLAANGALLTTTTPSPIPRCPTTWRC